MKSTRKICLVQIIIMKTQNTKQKLESKKRMSRIHEKHKVFWQQQNNSCFLPKDIFWWTFVWSLDFCRKALYGEILSSFKRPNTTKEMLWHVMWCGWCSSLPQVYRTRSRRTRATWAIPARTLTSTSCCTDASRARRKCRSAPTRTNARNASREDKWTNLSLRWCASCLISDRELCACRRGHRCHYPCWHCHCGRSPIPNPDLHTPDPPGINVVLVVDSARPYFPQKAPPNMEGRAAWTLAQRSFSVTHLWNHKRGFCFAPEIMILQTNVFPWTKEFQNACLCDVWAKVRLFSRWRMLATE